MRMLLLFYSMLAVTALRLHAVTLIATNVYEVSRDVEVAEEQWVFADIGEPAGRFKNDLFILTGNSLRLTGVYEGNLWGAAPMTYLTGVCARSVRLAGKLVKIEGRIDGNVMALAETIIIGSNALIEGHARLIGSSIVHEGLIRGNAYFSSARIITLDGPIEGNADVKAPDIFFSKNAFIGGNLNYTANKELFLSGGVLSGALNRIEPEAEPLFSTARIISRTLWFFAALLVGILFVSLFPMTAATMQQTVKEHPWKCLLVGIPLSAALPVLGFMCISSLLIIGVPLGSLIFVFWGVLIYLSRVIVGLAIGTMLLKSASAPISRRMQLALVLGLACIYLCTVIPAAGIPVQLIVLWLGMGSFILTWLEKRRRILRKLRDSNESNTIERRETQY